MPPLPEAGIDIGIVTLNLDAMLGFYRDLLGCAPAGEVPVPGRGRIVKLCCGASRIKLFIPDQSPTETPAAPDFLARAGLHYVTIQVDDIHGLMTACGQRGVNILVPLTYPRPGLTAAIVTDPDGNPVEFMQTTTGREGT
jgi:catechol 2,3-dioxygenase-like lactoylglutathione lyase family enzyme